MSEYSVIDYAPQHFEAVDNIWSQTGLGGKERGDSEDTIEKSLELGGRLLLLVDKSDSSIVGTSWMTFDGRRVHLHHFAIHPYFQGRGLSRLLMDESMKHVREKGYQVKLEVHSNNLKAINLYSRYGFKYLGDYDVYIIRELEGG